MNYVLSGAAAADLRGIARYTRKQWGSAQACHYRDKLEQGISRLADSQGPFTDLSAIYPALRMAHCEHHYIFCVSRDGAPALIVAIFHERMDLMTRLSERLKQ
ncbi:MAG: type II toxin-antitoxin system RelE/ParE family toxin [Betaproteobacteria bacterium]|nr:type II toxin-antitoxin system RelE/ParE family toxin [Betaproteobacteria bacterium]